MAIRTTKVEARLSRAFSNLFDSKSPSQLESQTPTSKVLNCIVHVHRNIAKEPALSVAKLQGKTLNVGSYSLINVSLGI